MALDIGRVRIGVAVSDPLGIFAQGVAVLKVREEWKIPLSELISRYAPDLVLIGLPVRTTGEMGPETEYVKKIKTELESFFPGLVFRFVDERFTTSIAEKAMIEGDLSREKRRAKIDQVAASLILQQYLDLMKGDNPS